MSTSPTGHSSPGPLPSQDSSKCQACPSFLFPTTLSHWDSEDHRVGHSWALAQAEESGSCEQEGTTEHLRDTGGPGQRQ